MADDTKSTTTDSPISIPGIDPALIEERIARIRELNEELLTVAKSAGNATLDAYESALTNLLQFQTKVAERSQLDWVSAIASAHASFVQDLSSAYLKAAREGLK